MSKSVDLICLESCQVSLYCLHHFWRDNGLFHVNLTNSTDVLAPKSMHLEINEKLITTRIAFERGSIVNSVLLNHVSTLLYRRFDVFVHIAHHLSIKPVPSTI